MGIIETLVVALFGASILENTGTEWIWPAIKCVGGLALVVALLFLFGTTSSRRSAMTTGRQGEYTTYEVHLPSGTTLHARQRLMRKINNNTSVWEVTTDDGVYLVRCTGDKCQMEK